MSTDNENADAWARGNGFDSWSTFLEHMTATSAALAPRVEAEVERQRKDPATQFRIAGLQLWMRMVHAA